MTWIPDDRGIYNIRASKEGYLPSIINPIHVSLGEVKISDVNVEVTRYTATFRWKTDKPVRCELTVDGIPRGVSYKSTSHREEAIGLPSGRTYEFIIEVVDGEGSYKGSFTTEGEEEVKISDVDVEVTHHIATNTATFRWKTDKPARCKLTVDGILRGVTHKSTSHREEAVGLGSGRTYEFIIEVVGGEGRYEGTFTTESYW
ncbi:MAG TPA: hypothetical protein HA348_02605 [Thermoplasmata archaeon]|nr:hypothetical protein [Thermoplasmata archaeon]